jgi:hypothetical protein
MSSLSRPLSLAASYTRRIGQNWNVRADVVVMR